MIEGVRMNTIIIEHADEKLTSLFRQMAEIAGVPLKTKPEKEGKVITNPEISKAIEEYESGITKGTTISEEKLKERFENMIAG